MASNRGGERATGVNEHVEFVVKAAEDLILEGKERTIVRVRAGTPYSCLMLKNQRFSSLFRHYAKHHGLRKEDLAYFFTEALQNEDTPESIFLQPRDEVIVRKRRTQDSDEEEEEPLEDTASANERYISQVGSLMSDEDEHCDVTFYAGEARAPVRAHKMILVARSEYFKGMLRKNAMREGQTSTINIESHEEQPVRWMLEFIYTNRVADLHRCTAEQIAAVLSIAEEYLLSNLKSLCEHTAKSIITTANVARLLSAAEQYHASSLRKACMRFVHQNMAECANSQVFGSELRSTPQLCISILRHISGDTKGGVGGGSGSSAGDSLIAGANGGRAKRRRVDIEVDADEDRRGA